MKINYEAIAILSAMLLAIICLFIGVIIYAGIGPALITLGACLFLASITSYATFSR